MWATDGNASKSANYLTWSKQGSLSVFYFSSFFGHRLAQREWARRGLISPMWGSIPTQSHNPKGWPHLTTGDYVPYSFRTVVWVLLCPTSTHRWKRCETGPTVFRPYLKERKKWRQRERPLLAPFHRRKMSDWSTRDHVTLPNSKWRQYLHRL